MCLSSFIIIIVSVCYVLCVVYALWLKFTHTNFLSLVNVLGLKQSIAVDSLLKCFFSFRFARALKNKILYRIKWNRWIKCCYEQLQTTIAHIRAKQYVRKSNRISSAQTKLHNLLMVKVIERNRKKIKKDRKKDVSGIETNKKKARSDSKKARKKNVTHNLLKRKHIRAVDSLTKNRKLISWLYVAFYFYSFIHSRRTVSAFINQ